MTTLRYCVTSDFVECKSDWFFLQSSPLAYPFQTYEWASTWWDCIGRLEAEEAAIVRIYGGADDPIALLPLCIQKKRGLRSLCFMGGRLADYCAPLLSPSATFGPGEILRVIRQIGRNLGCAVVYFSNVPEILGGNSANPLVDEPFSPMNVLSHQARLSGDFESYFAKAFSSKSRYNLRRSEKFLAEGGGLEYRIARDAASLEEITLAMIAQKRNRYRATGVPDLFASPGYEDFFRVLNRQAPDLVAVSALYKGNKPIATHWGMAMGESLYYLMPTFAEGESAKFSPGSILTMRILEDAWSKGLRVVDFTLGDEAYKKNWCDTSTRLFRLLLPLSPLGFLAWIADSAKISMGH